MQNRYIFISTTLLILSITVDYLSIFITGNSYVVDADLKEESVTKVRITFGFDSNENVRFMSKDGFGSLDPDSLYSIIDVGLFLLLFKI